MKLSFDNFFTILYPAASKRFLVFNVTFDVRWTNIILYIWPSFLTYRLLCAYKVLIMRVWKDKQRYMQTYKHTNIYSHTFQKTILVNQMYAYSQVACT